MRFILYQDKLVKAWDGRKVTWIERGMYPIVRWFDNGRVLVDVGGSPEDKPSERTRQLTVLNLDDGELNYGG